MNSISLFSVNCVEKDSSQREILMIILEDTLSLSNLCKIIFLDPFPVKNAKSLFIGRIRCSSTLTNAILTLTKVLIIQKNISILSFQL